MCYQTQKTLIFVICFSGIGQCFQPTQSKSLENQKFAMVGLLWIKYDVFSKYSRPLHKLVCRQADNDNTQNSKISEISWFFKVYDIVFAHFL